MRCIGTVNCLQLYRMHIAIQIATGKHMYTVEAKNGAIVLSAAKAIGSSFAGLQYVDLNQDGKVTVQDVLLLVKAYVGKQYTDVSLLDVLRLLKCL